LPPGALDFLLKLLKQQTPAEVHVLNVQHRTPLIDRIAGGRPSECSTRRNRRWRLAGRLLAPAMDALKAAGIPHVAKVVVGDAPHAITDPKAHHCEGIVMGTHGHGAVSTLMLGSVAHKVLHLTHVPVTFVR
jgi:nucleotide-binding universal stress UspA family protein